MANNNKKYKVGKSKIQGKGVFSKQDLNPGDYIGKAHTINKLYTDYDFTDLGKNHNHSDSPNTQNVLIGNERHFVATKPIKKGQEITTNYRLQPDLEQPEDFEQAKGGKKLTASKAQNGIEGTMGGLTDKGFNYNPAWGGAWKNGGWMDKYQDGGEKPISVGPSSSDQFVDIEPIRYENRPGIGEVGILPSIVIAPHLNKQGEKFLEKIIDRQGYRPEERYEPSDAVKNTKGAIAAGAIATMRSPEVQYLTQLAGATGDFYTGTRYAFDKNWSKAGEDYVQGLLGLIPYSKALKGMKGDEYFTTLQKIYNGIIGGLKIGSDVKTIHEAYDKKQNGGMLQPPMAGAIQTVPMAQDGLRFLQPTSPKLPMGYEIPYGIPSTEQATSIGGEEGQPAYLVPSFKYGKLLDDPYVEFEKTKEVLGGPFSTIKEADEFARMRHEYVEKGQDIPSPVKWWGKDYALPNKKLAMGGSLPGATGMMYARTAGAAPSEGPYAKKTLPSAQDGMTFYQHGLDWKPRNISRDGSSVNRADEYPLQKLDDLLNFTNYNKPKAKSGGWLDKYN